MIIQLGSAVYYIIILVIYGGNFPHAFMQEMYKFAPIISKMSDIIWYKYNCLGHGTFSVCAMTSYRIN